MFGPHCPVVEALIGAEKPIPTPLSAASCKPAPVEVIAPEELDPLNPNVRRPLTEVPLYSSYF